MTFDQFFARLSLSRALALAALLWAAIYLPALGSLEIKGEEGRRILPAVAMLDTGDWLVPQVGGVPYFSKPPLINWLVAKSFQWTGTRSEWAARLPSALAALALALTAVWSLACWLGAGGGLLCAVFLLTNIGLMEKGRLAEIESLYVSLYGIALLLWLGAWRSDAPDVYPAARPRFPWRVWTLPPLFLGLGMLTKSPLHVAYFYAVVVGILICAGRWREVFNRAHLLGILLMLGIFAAWALPYFREVRAGEAAGKWYAQMAGRAEVGENFSLGGWLLTAPRGLVNFLPWTVLLPLAWQFKAGRNLTSHIPHPTSSDSAVARGLSWSLAICFAVVSLAPGGIPRYTLPLIVPASILLALAFSGCRATVPVAVGDDGEETIATEDATSNRSVPPRQRGPLPYNLALPLVWTRTLAVCLIVAVLAAPVAAVLGGKGIWHWLVALMVVTLGVYLLRRLRRLSRFAEDPPPGAVVPGVLPLALASTVVMALLTTDYAIGAVHRLQRLETVRPVGAAIRRVVHAGQPVAVLQPNFLPFAFYLDKPRYVQTPDAVAADVHYLLVREPDFDATTTVLQKQGREPHILLRVRDKRAGDSGRGIWLLLGLDRPGSPSL